MPKQKKKKIMVLSFFLLLVCTMVWIEFNWIILKNSRIHLNSSVVVPPSKIKISEELYDSLPERYLRNYPNEYGMCIYGTRTGYNISIFEGEEPVPLTQSKKDVEIMCPLMNKGFEMIGLIHSHPDDSWCSLSENDISLGNTVMGLQCNENKILFFSKLDNYARGYYVRTLS